MFHTIPENFFAPPASLGKTIYWDCICKLFTVMDNQLSFGMERDAPASELKETPVEGSRELGYHYFI